MVYNLIAGSLLSFVYIKTKPVIEANKLAKAGDGTRIEVLPGMDGGFEQGESAEFSYWTGYTDSGKRKPGGYVFISTAKGYSSTLEIIAGVDMDGFITGVKILFQQETPGLGDKIEAIKAGESDPWFTRQLLGKSSLETLSVTKDGGTIDAITGATISSRAVCAAVSNGVMKLIEVNGDDTFSRTVDLDDIAPVIPAPEEEKAIEPVEITDELLAEVLPNMAGGYKIQDENSESPYWAGYRDSGGSQPGGYAFLALGEGFASTIQTLVGIDPEGKIISVKVLAHEETEGYGDKLGEIREGESDPWFLRQFIGKAASDNIALTEDGGSIDALSEATITSNAVTKSINIGIKKLMNKISGETFEIPEEEAEEETGVMPSDEDLATVLPDMIGEYELQDEGGEFPYWIGYSDFMKSEPGGYIFIARGEGFASTVSTLVAVDTEGSIVGVKVLSHEETEGYGDKLGEIREGESEPWFTRQFIGKAASDNIALTEDGGSIDALTEATITSNAVTKSINTGIKKLMGIITGETFELPEEENEEAEDTVVMPSNEDLAAVLPDMIGEYELQDEDSEFPYWIGFGDFMKSEPGGYIFVARGEGFASTIVTLVAVDTEGSIVGVKVLFHEETEGYGEKLGEIRDGESEPWFLRQFIGKTVSDTIALSEDGGAIDAMTEATITSKAVAGSIDSGLNKLMEILGNSGQ